MTERVLTLAEVAEVFKVSVRHVERLVAQGRDIVPGVRAFQVGSVARVSQASVDAFLASQAGERVAS